MLTALECLPCFLRQALYAARLSTPVIELQKMIVNEVAYLLPNLDMDCTPPENSILVYETIARLSGCSDPFIDLKRTSNMRALELLPRLREVVSTAADPMCAAIRLAMAGNIIDYGAHHDFDLNQAIDDCLAREPAINHYAQLLEDLRTARTVLYLGDNCGELVFDGLVLEKLNHEVTLAVKERPIINDALVADALFCGLDRLATVMANGTSCPGTPVQRCSPAFQEAFAAADLIISKGQGNFETLSETRAPLYFLLMVKCPVVAEHIAALTDGTPMPVTTGDLVLLRTPHWK
jgi:uncharacterized protein with ATP-grasp and redox domains